jgi:fibronectin type 3 domain-containing protein
MSAFCVSLMLSSLALPLGAQAAAEAIGDWEISVIDSVGDVGRYSSVAIANGTAFISYYDATNDHLKFATNSSGLFTTTTIENGLPGGQHTSLAIDKRGKAHISYTTVDGGYLLYTDNVAGRWSLSAIANGIGPLSGSSIALDPGGYSYVVYYDSMRRGDPATEKDLKYGCNSDGSWRAHLIVYPGDVGRYASLSVDEFTHSHTVFYDATNHCLRYNYDFFTNRMETVDASGDVGAYTSIDLDINNKPHVSYYDIGNGALKYADRAGPNNNWVAQTVDDSGDVGLYTSIKVDSFDRVHISYYDNTTHTLKYARGENGVFNTYTVDASGDVGQYSSIAVDPSGRPCITYYDATNGDLKLAKLSSLGPVNGLRATAGIKQVSLNWTAPSGTVGSIVYNIYRGIYPGFLSMVAETTSTAFLDLGLNNDVTYYYQVVPTSGGEVGPRSPEIPAVPRANAHAPTLLSATPDIATVALHWSPPVEAEGTITGYSVLIGTAPDDIQVVALLPADARDYTVTGLSRGISYLFCVLPQYGSIGGPSSNILTAMISNAPSTPVLTSATSGNHSVAVIWEPQGVDPIDGFTVQVGERPDVLVDRSPDYPSSARTALIDGLVPGKLYYFAVKAFNTVGNSSASNVLSAVAVQEPGAPTLVSATTGPSKITLVWTAPADAGYGNISTYEVYFGQGNVSNIYGRVGAAQTSIEVVGLQVGLEYQFAVKAVNEGGAGNASNVMAALFLDGPGPPTLLAALPGFDNVTLQWSPPTYEGSGPVTGYFIWYGTGAPDHRYGEVLPATARGAVVQGLVSGTAYAFAVSAVNYVGDGQRSENMTATPFGPPGAPSGLQLTARVGMVNLTWQASFANGSAVTHYQILRGGEGGLQEIAQTQQLRYSDQSAMAGMSYSYQVRAVNQAGAGEGSALMTVTVPTMNMALITGKVVDGNGRVISGVRVAMENGSYAITDTFGNYSMMAAEGSHTLTYSGGGLEAQSRAVSLGSSGLDLGALTMKQASTDNTLLIILAAVLIVAAVGGLLLWKRRR